MSLALEPTQTDTFASHPSNPYLVDFSPLKRDKPTSKSRIRGKSSLNLVTTLRRTASQLLIISAFLPRLSASNRSLDEISLSSSVNISSRQLTLRQLYYTCKPLLQRGRAFHTPLSAFHAPALDHTDKSSVDGSQHALRPSEPPPYEDETLSDVTSQVPPDYVYECINRLGDTLQCHREHLFIEAEGHALFCARSIGKTTNLPTSLQAIIRQFAATKIITRSVIDSFNALAQAYIDERADSVIPQISIFAVEKEGVYEQILRQLERSIQPRAPKSRSNKAEVDNFEKYVMSHFRSSSSYFASQKARNQTKIVFLVCSKGFPDQATKSLLRAIHFFHTMTLLPTSSSQLSPNGFQTPPIRCFADCNPSGVLIALNLSPDGSPLVEWTGLLPSQLASMPEHRSKWQPLTKRDHSILSNLLLKAVPGSGIATELSLMQTMNVKAELQILFT